MENTGEILFEDELPTWYVVVGSRWIGPITTTDLYERVHSQFFSWAHYAWRKGQPAWKRLCDIDELKKFVPQQPDRSVQKEVKKSVDPADRPTERSADKRSMEKKEASARSPKVIQASAHAQTSPPVDQTSSKKKWFLHYNDSQYGPFSQKEILRSIAMGKINGRVHAWSDGMKNWDRLERIEVFHDEISAIQGGRASPGASSVKSSSQGSSKSSERNEKRSTMRRPLVAKVMIADEQNVIVGICRDISIGGLQVLTDQVPGPAGSRLKMNVSPSATDEGEEFTPFVADGVIVRLLEDGRGFSFRFKKLSESARKAIEEYIESTE